MLIIYLNANTDDNNWDKDEYNLPCGIHHDNDYGKNLNCCGRESTQPKWDVSIHYTLVH